MAYKSATIKNGQNFIGMNTSSSIKKRRPKPVIKYLLLGFYYVLIGFCGVGVWLKWDDVNYNKSVIDYSLHVYEEGFEAVSVSVPSPRSDRKESFLSKLARRTTPKPVLVTRPERNKRGQEAWQKYAATDVKVPEGNAKVVLVIDDLGIVKGATREMIDMDVPLTLSFLPYASGIAKQVDDAYSKGHDILVHIPMEPKGKADPGPHALLSSTSGRVQLENIDYNLSQFSNFIGVNNHMGSQFTEDAEAVDRLLGVIKDKGLLVLDSKTTPNSQLENRAREKGIPVTNRDVFLDNERDHDYILGQLTKLEHMAKSNGTALAIGHPYSQTISALKQWIPTLKEKGITIVPISQTVREKYSRAQLAAVQ